MNNRKPARSSDRSGLLPDPLTLAGEASDYLVDAWQRAALKSLPQDADGVRRWLREERATRRRWGD